MHLYALTCDKPFSMIFLDMWKPPEKDNTHEVLMMLDGMMGFAAGAFLGKPITGDVLADVMFFQFFRVFDLPWLIVPGSESRQQALWHLQEILQEFGHPCGNGLT
jgi:hypothetical protein